MTDQDLIQQLQTAMLLLAEVKQELYQRQTAKNDPLEFYANYCVVKQNAEITASDLFCAYKNWCFNNGSLSRGRRPFLDAIAQLGAADSVTGVMRGKAYTFKNLALKTN